MRPGSVVWPAGRPGDRRRLGTGVPAERQPDPLRRVAQPVDRPRVVADGPRPSLGADALRAGGNTADGPAHPHPEPDRRAASREVGDGAAVATVAAMCATLAGGAACGPAGDEEPEGYPFLGDGDLGETQPFAMGQERRKAQATSQDRGDSSQTGQHRASAAKRPRAIIESRQDLASRGEVCSARVAFRMETSLGPLGRRVMFSHRRLSHRALSRDLPTLNARIAAPGPAVSYACAC